MQRHVTKITSFLFALLLTHGLLGQSNPDLGIVLSLNDESRYGLEYRLPKDEQFTYKLGVTHGTFISSWVSQGIVAASDSLVVQKTIYRSNNQWEIRIGGERKIKESLFSLGADLNLGYLRHEKRQFNTPTVIDENGNWVRGYFVESAAQIPSNNPNHNLVIGDSDYANIKQHFFLPSLRVTFNLNVPISDALVVSFSIATRFGVPVYMGATEVENHNRIAIGSPPTTFDIGTTAIVGLRYIIGSFKTKVNMPDQP